MYSLSVNQDGISLQYKNSGTGKVLGLWPLTKTYGADEFVALELRAIGNRLTVLAEGQIVGTVESNDLMEPGGLQLWARANSHWRDAEYIPLEKGFVDNASIRPQRLPPVQPPTPLPAPVRLWDSPDKAREAGATWENEALRLDARAVKHQTTQLRDVIFRATVRMNPDAQQPAISIRVNRQPEIGQDAGYGVVIADGGVQLQVLPVGAGQKRLSLINWPLPRAYGPDEWVALEIRAVGSRFTVLMDGQILGTIEDSRLPIPGTLMVFAKANGCFRDIEYVPLDSPPSLQAPTATPAPAGK